MPGLRVSQRVEAKEESNEVDPIKCLVYPDAAYVCVFRGSNRPAGSGVTYNHRNCRR